MSSTISSAILLQDIVMTKTCLDASAQGGRPDCVKGHIRQDSNADSLGLSSSEVIERNVKLTLSDTEVIAFDQLEENGVKCK